MPDYLSPGVYVEEYESGARTVSGVSTSIPGFLGLAEKGGTSGMPQLVTGAADFQRKYGGYLPRAWGDYRFLRYAVEQFFLNGGSLCYIMRVKAEGSEAAARVVSFAHKFCGIVITAKKDAADDFNITITPAHVGGTGIKEKEAGKAGNGNAGGGEIEVSEDEAEKIYTCGEDLNLMPGDTVLVSGTTTAKNKESAVISGFFTVASYSNQEVTFTAPLPDDLQKCTNKTLCNSDFNMSFDKPSVTLNGLSFNRRSANYFVKKCAAAEGLRFIVAQENEPVAYDELFNWVKSGKAHVVEFRSGYPYIKLTAANEGLWGNRIKAEFKGGSTTKLSLGELAKDEELGSCEVKGGSAFRAGDIAAIVPAELKGNWLDKPEVCYAVVSKVSGNTIFFKETVRIPEKGDYYLHLCDILIKISCDDTEETYEQLTLNSDSPDYIGNRLSKSELVRLEANSAQIYETRADVLSHPFKLMFPDSTGDTEEFMLNGGEDGNLTDKLPGAFRGEDGIPGEKTGLAAFTDNTQISMIAAPGVTDRKIQADIVAHCDNLQSRFAILDIPCQSRTVDDIMMHRDTVESSFAAMYHPWLEAYDYLERVNTYMPPSGAAAGIYARVDQSRGVFKAPANEPLKGILGLSRVYGRGEQAILSPKGVNLIIPFSGQGIRIWGARTCSSNSLWRYVNVRRLFIYMEESIKANTNWVVFEPNDKFLWLRVQRTISEFLEGLWRDGALFGSAKEEAFFVEIGESTMTQDDIDNGRLICRIGVAPVKPAEFVIFRITQKTKD